MAGIRVKNAKSPDETRTFVDKGKLDVLQLGDVSVGLAYFQPGWRWSEHVRPLAGTDTCESSHTGYCLSGRMRIRMDDGEEQDIGPGDAFTIEPGHDAWVLGQDVCALLDFTGFENYARPAVAARTQEARPGTMLH
jgi:quercetin dioxygenase-like cupin family protein